MHVQVKETVKDEKKEYCVLIEQGIAHDVIKFALLCIYGRLLKAFKFLYRKWAIHLSK